jgi:hypothetical protein
VGLASSSEFVAAVTRPKPSQQTGSASSTSFRISFPFATRTAGVHYRRTFHSAPDVPPSAFLTLSTGCSSAGRVGLFHPTATSGIALQGFSPPSSRRASSTLRSLLAFSADPLTATEVSAATYRPRALQGVDPNGDPLPADRWFRPVRSSIPSCVFNSRGLVSEHLGPALATPPLVAFATRGSLSPVQLTCSVSIGARPAVLSLDQLPVGAW